MATPTLNAIDLGQVSNIDVDKSANLLPLPLPTGDSDETEVFDMLGVIKTITVSGTITDTSTANVVAIVDSLEALADGDQAASVNFVSDQTGVTPITVKVSRVQTSWNLPGLVSVNYTLQLIQGA